MHDNLNIMAGGFTVTQADAERVACVDALSQVIDDLKRQGMAGASIVAALAVLTVRTIGLVQPEGCAGSSGPHRILPI
jgi:hypothetical protein